MRLSGLNFSICRIAAEKSSSISSADSATLIFITTINQLTGFFAEGGPSNRKPSIASVYRHFSDSALGSNQRTFRILRRSAARPRRIVVLDMDELARMNQEEDDKGGARNAIILAVVVILVGAYCLMFGLQTLIWIGAKQWVSANPWLGDVPQQLPASSADPAKGSQEKAFNYEFVVPWKGPGKPAPSPTGVQFSYDSGQVVVFFDPEVQIDTAHALRSPATPEAQKLASVFAGRPIESNYTLYQAVYGASLAPLSPVMKEQEAVRNNVLLLWKLSFGPDLESGTTPEFYSFEWGKIKGFQFGDPSQGHPVALHVFDDYDKQFRFIFTAAGGASGKITQDDINATVKSLQPVPIVER